ncbi:hypothetical protein [Nocardia testacea]|uniref:hypothetical protein n=1 Tax=Nocardia testacea TaxID=248551 RepID=UPI003A863949
MSVPGFLILYKRRSGEYQVIEYGGQEGRRAALSERLRLEASDEFPGEEFEVAALFSDSLESVKKTHSRYFQGEKVEFV